MSLQLIEAYVPNKYFKQVNEKLGTFDLKSYWFDNKSLDRVMIRVLVESGRTEDILNYFEKVSHVVDGFEVILLPVEAYIERDVKEEQEEKTSSNNPEMGRVSRQELYTKMEVTSKLNLSYLMYILLSSVVVTIGLIKNSSAVIIGGMVIAPLLGPVMALAFASILGDFRLLRGAVVSSFIGMGLAMAVSVIMGWFFTPPVHSEEFISRTHVNVEDIVLAFVSGAAGAISIIKKEASAFVGVMVAVALMPPIVVVGMSMAAGLWSNTLHASLLLLVNVFSILLAAVIVFSLTGIRPVKYEEVKRASNSKKYSILFICIIVVILLIAVIYSNNLS